MARHFVPSAAPLLSGNDRMAEWEARVREIGHGRPTDLGATAALEIARAAAPEEGLGVEATDPLSLHRGERVSVTPADYGKVPVTGELVTLTMTEVAVRREAREVGTL
jgi:hypothetical protein